MTVLGGALALSRFIGRGCYVCSGRVGHSWILIAFSKDSSPVTTHVRLLCIDERLAVGFSTSLPSWSNARSAGSEVAK